MANLSNVPVGTIIAFAGPLVKANGASNVPDGFLPCDGRSVLETDYNALYLVIGEAWGNGQGKNGAFNLPDLRGLFARGVDHGAGRDPEAATRTSSTGGSIGDEVGSYQVDEVGPHTHIITNGDSSNTGFATMTQGESGNNAGYLGVPVNLSCEPNGGLETRPKNVYVEYLICYQNASPGQGAS